MTTTTSTVDLSSVLSTYIDGAIVTGPTNGVWTIDVADMYDQATLDAAVTAAAADVTASANTLALIAKAVAAQSANATFLALPAPTNAQVLAQVKSLTRQVNALIKLGTGTLNDTSGT